MGVDPKLVEQVTWESGDRWIASVTPGGMLFGNRRGTTRVIASLHGWVADTLVVTVRGDSPPRLALQDSLGEVDGKTWVVVSDPRPRIIEADGRPVLWLRGNGQYADGLISRGTFDLSRGATLTVEFRFAPLRSTGDRLVMCLQDSERPPGSRGRRTRAGGSGFPGPPATPRSWCGT